jgi:Na+-driven multidrug efflux pump
VTAAAVATVIAQGVVCGLFVGFVKRHPQRPFEYFHFLGRVSCGRARQIVRWSLPVALESGAFTALAMVVTGMVSDGYGENAVAVQRVGSQIESLSWLIGGVFSSAVTSFMGPEISARQVGAHPARLPDFTGRAARQGGARDRDAGPFRPVSSSRCFAERRAPGHGRHIS